MTTTESESTLCTCTCEDSTVDNITKLNERIASLKLPKTTLSMTRRKLTSADDQRPSARGAGAVGVFVLVTFLAVIILFDLSRFCSRSKEWRNATFRKLFQISPSWKFMQPLDRKVTFTNDNYLNTNMKIFFCNNDTIVSLIKKRMSKAQKCKIYHIKKITLIIDKHSISEEETWKRSITWVIIALD